MWIDEMLSAEERDAIAALLAHYPGNPRAVAIDALMTIRMRRGWVSDSALADLAEAMQVSAHELDSVATFYNLIFRKPVGRHVILLCDSVSCWIMGYDTVRALLEQRLGIELGGTTADGRFTLLTVPCLGACDEAPAMMIDEDLHGHLTPERIESILERYE
jgi:NADH-quinone oxidoreductase subunit E